MGTIEDQKKLTDGKGWKAIKTLSKELKDKVKKIAKPFVDESVAIRHLTKKLSKKK
jgi:hypothetical protein